MASKAEVGYGASHRFDTCYLALPLLGVPDEEQLFKKPRQVVHKNTRFLRDPFSQALSRSQLQQAAALNAQVSGQNHQAAGQTVVGKLLLPWLSPLS